MVKFKAKGEDENPFRPGYGNQPPLLAGREREQRLLGARISGLFKDGDTRGLVIYGPRGMGKTVLLGWAREKCAEIAKAAGREMSVIRTSASRLLGSQEVMLDMLLGEHQVEQVETTVRGGVPGALQGSVKTTVAPRPRWAALEESLVERCRRSPFVLLLDEAHVVDGTEEGLYREFLNTAQEVASRAPFLLVLAGTPDLPDTIGSLKSTFISRAKEIGVGLLPEEGAKDAIRVPLADDGITIDEDALSLAVKDGQCYPYFIQLWGEHLWLAAMEKGEGHLTMRDAESARESVQSERVNEYKKRYREIAKNAITKAAAVAVASAFQDKALLDEDYLRERVEESLSQHQPQGSLDKTVDEQVKTLQYLGFVWVPPGEDAVRPGIPSLMDYTLGRIRRGEASH